MDVIAQKILLAGLLHDIGKFYQRADDLLFNGNIKNQNNEVGEVSFNLAQSICPPNDNGRFGYQHVVWTSQFFENKAIREVLEKVPGLKDNVWKDNTQDSVVNLACNHHLPGSRLQQLIQFADWWSAGIDRTQPGTFEVDQKPDESIKWGKGRYKKIPLYSIFNKMKGGNFQAGFKLNPLSIDDKEHLFPIQITGEQDGLNQRLYRELWDAFVKEFVQLPTDSFNGFIDSLTFLLKKFTWCIPSNTSDMSDVSLFEHLKTTAAFGHCLYRYFNETSPEILNSNKSDGKITPDNDVFPVILVGGDISGIQKFIYNIASSKASKSLKGRSFYLQLLIDSILQQILSHPMIQANQTHIVYASGGKFYALLPNTPAVVEALQSVTNNVQNELWKDHHGTIAFNTAYVPFAYRSRKTAEKKWESFVEMNCENGTVESNTGGLWKQLADRLTIKKNKPFESIIAQHFDKLFNEQSDELKSGGLVKTCAVTGSELKEGEFKKLDDEIYVTNRVFEQTELGQALKDVDYLITFQHLDQEPAYLNNRAHAKIKVAKVNHYLFDKVELAKDEADFRKISSADVSAVYRINNTDFIIPLKGKATSYGFKFYGGNEQACFRNDKGEILTYQIKTIQKKAEKTFEQLTQTRPKDTNSETYLGVLRMDVDNLGDIFINGLPDAGKSFAAFATLSFQLDLFFSGYLNTLRNNIQFRDWVNVLYAGGDDVFAIGRWDKLIEFAHHVRVAFDEFTGRNDITLSAGLAIVNNKFPIAKAADLAEDAEKAAKNHAINEEKNKNAFCFLGETVSWHEEFSFVKSWKNKLIEMILHFNMPKSILHRIMLYGQMNKANIKNRETAPEKVNMSFKWNAAYNLKRFSDRQKPNEIKAFIKDLQTELFIRNEYQFNLIVLAARWAELELKVINL